jgi:hypothetical protein
MEDKGPNSAEASARRKIAAIAIGTLEISDVAKVVIELAAQIDNLTKRLNAIEEAQKAEAEPSLGGD